MSKDGAGRAQALMVTALGGLSQGWGTAQAELQWLVCRDYGSDGWATL